MGFPQSAQLDPHNLQQPHNADNGERRLSGRESARPQARAVHIVVPGGAAGRAAGRLQGPGLRLLEPH